MTPPYSYATLQIIIFWSILAMVTIEFALGLIFRLRLYSLGETAASAFMLIPQKLLRMLSLYISLPIATFCYQFRLFEMDVAHLLYWPALFLGVEFLYYWNHRLSHEVRWLWATHAVHHSSPQLNVLASLRVGSTSVISGNFLFFLPLSILGFEPVSISIMFGFNLLYQAWLHTELVGRLGWLDAVFNTPANHRVHHSCAARNLDRNFGGTVILFDRLFGTYQAEVERRRDYGIVGELPSVNPLVIILRPWRLMLQEARRGDWQHAVKTLFGRSVRCDLVADAQRIDGRANEHGDEQVDIASERRLSLAASAP
jgi:sterol desaturase/sphingolipid hydroxylase (fatty acid hydroxylase superfamily)